MIKRELYLNKIRQFIDLDFIKVITGVRRSGKSYLLKLIIDELIQRGINENNILLIDFELPEYNHIKNREELDEIVLDFINSRKNNVYLLFDEIQNVKDWEISINSYYKLSNTDVYVAGSNSNLLNGSLATFLTGRYISIEMYPFSFNEFCEYNGGLTDPFDEYLKYGGFPLAKEYMTLLDDILASILLNDIFKRYEIRNVELLFRIIDYLMENVGNVISPNLIYNHLKEDNLKLTKNTVYAYLNYLAEAGFLLKLIKEDLATNKKINGVEKYYLIDHGFLRTDKEKMLENIVYLELLRQGYKVTFGKIRDYEVDFICKKDGTRVYIQVSYLLSDEKFTPLLEIKDNYPKYVITMDKINMSRSGIKHLNVINFLRNNTQL
jgi:uncharacterized protein